MKKYLLFALLAAATCFYGCKKDTITKANKQFIVGKWAPLRERVRVYDTNNNLVRDSSYNVPHDANYYYETFNSNGTAYVTTDAGDTTSRLGYSIDHSQLTIYQDGDKGDKSNPLYLTMLQSSATNLGLESQLLAKPPQSWGLDENTIYNFLIDISFKKN